MEDRVIVVIDDNDQTKNVEERIVQHLKKQGLEVKSIVINPNTQEFFNDNSDIDLDKLVNGIKQLAKGYHIDLIACDYELGDKNVNGFTVIEKLRGERFKKCPIILYSGKEGKVIANIFDSPESNDDKKQRLTKLIKCRITTFADRPNYPNEIIRNLKKVNIASILTRKLREYGSKRITSIETFSTYTLNQIADKVDISQTNEQLITEIIELTLAHYISINENIGEDNTSS
ncbi:MAG: hypothetical protein AAF944_27460 [Bacteroidota bacterium]